MTQTQIEKKHMLDTIGSIENQLDVFYDKHSLTIFDRTYKHFTIPFGKYTLSIALIYNPEHPNTVETALMTTDNYDFVWGSNDNDEKGINVDDNGIIGYLPFSKFEILCNKMFNKYVEGDDEGVRTIYVDFYLKHVRY